MGLFIYPAKGQTPDQQRKDEAACHEWAEANTGLDAASRARWTPRPAGGRPRAPPGKAGWSEARPRGSRPDCVIGAISGDPGKGAAIGAVAGSVGGLRGGVRARREAEQAGAQQSCRGKPTGRRSSSRERRGRASRRGADSRKMTGALNFSLASGARSSVAPGRRDWSACARAGSRPRTAAPPAGRASAARSRRCR